jgi:predicted Zn-dependent protease
MAKWQDKLATTVAFISICAGLFVHGQEIRTTGASDGKQSSSASQPGKKHQDAKDDINAIGNRKIGGIGPGNWYSLESEIRMGREYSQAVDSQVKLLDDPIVTEYVNRMGQNLVRNSDAKVPFTFKVIDSEEVNAFSLPGGFLYVDAGLILAADNEAELAGVMAHEIAHIAARHATRQMTRSNLMSILSLPLVFVGGGVGLALQGITSVGTPLAFTKFSRGFEAEADYLGVEYMYQAGYDPEALISFFEKIKSLEHGKPGTLARAFASHPQTPDRVRKSQAEIARILPIREQYIVTTSDFDVTKAHLSEIEERRQKMRQDRPVLRRRPAASTNTDSDKSADDDRPVLKRRDQK